MGTCLHIVVSLQILASFTLFLLPGDTSSQVNFGEPRKFQGSNGRPSTRSPNFTSRPVNRPPRLAVQNRYEAAPCPKNEVFCEKVEDYPTNLRNEYGNFSEFYQSLPVSDINPRTNFNFDQPEEEIRACDVRRSTVFPRKAKNLKGEYMFILNSKDFPQAIQIERCIGEDQPCLLDEDAPNPGSTSCKQQYASYQLYAVNENGTSIVETFRLPSACTCHHKEIGLDLGLGPRIANKRVEKKKQAEIISPVCNQTVRDLENIIDTRIVNRRTKLPVCKKQQRIAKRDRVVFPDARENAQSNLSTTRKPAQSNRRTTRKPAACRKLKVHKCKTGTVCESSQDYPEEIVQASLRRMSDRLRKLYLKQACLDPLDTIGTRSQFFTEEIQLCQGVNKIMVPTSGLNVRGEWKTIVNIPGYTQTINVEECGESFRSTNSCTYSGTFGRQPDQTNCQQLHREHNMLTINDDTLEIEVDVIKIPSACACFYRRNYNPSLLVRSGNGKS